MMTEEERKYWLGFSAFPGIGPLRFKLLREYFGSAKKAWEADQTELIKIGLGEKLTAKFVAFRKTFSIPSFIAQLKQKKISVLTLQDKEYPPLLMQIADPPLVLYIKGKATNILNISKTIAVVGTRRITGYGREVTKRIVAGLVDAGLTIVSGMAYGVDGVAHETAIESGGKTIAVLGCGVDIIHPVSNTKLYWKIVEEKGFVVSEFPPGLTVTKGLFPARNRIISGLSLGTVVTEGAEDSGSLITARFAAEQGREVFAVPGPITSSLSKGPILLLKQGAKMVTEVEDILEELKIFNKPIIQSTNKYQLTNNQIKALSKEERRVISLLENENLHFDELVSKSGIPSSTLASLLTMMELKRYVKNSSGGVYSISS